MKRLFAALLMGCSLAWGQTLEVIELRNRGAETLLPQLAPFVEPGGAITGAGDKLFLRASARNRADLRALVASLDTPVRRLMISVRQEASDAASERSAGISGRVKLGADKATALQGGRAKDALRAVADGETAISARGHLQQSDSSGRRDVSQQVQTIDGGRAAILVGQSFFLPLRQLVMTPAGVIVSESLVQRDLGTGFVAVPRLVGERVTLEISPRDDTPGPLPGSVNVQRLLTTVGGRLGEWLELGGSAGEQSGSTGAIAAFGARSSSHQRRLFLKVEELP